MSRIRGLELLFGLQGTNIRSKVDCLVAALHCMLINENLQCIGIGEFSETEDTAHATELLPDHWNDNQDYYMLKYTSRDAQNRYQLKVIVSGHVLNVNVIVNEDHVYGISLDVNQYVTDDYGDYRTAYKELDELISAFTTEVLDKIREHKTVNNPHSNERKFPKGPVVPPNNPRPSGALDIDEEEPLPFTGVNPNNPHPKKFPRVGDRDRDPTGRGQGSMHFDPCNLEDDPTPIRPRGKGSKSSNPPQVPPGARHDPLAPVKGPDKGRPNPDHYKPPDNDNNNNTSS